MKIPLQKSSLSKGELERYSSALTLSAIEIEMFPELVSAQWMANMMSPSLWRWAGLLPRRSGSPIRRKVEGIKQYIIHHYSFTHMDDQPGLCPCGVTDIAAEERRFFASQWKEDFFEQLKRTFLRGESTPLGELLGIEDIREFYNLSGYPEGTIPLWGNEIIEKMDAYREIALDQKGSGKCEALATLYAAALIIVGKFPWQHVSIWLTPSHVMTYLMEGGGYLSSNKRMFSATSLRNLNEHTAIVKSCLEKERIRRIQTLSGFIHESFETFSMSPKTLRKILDHFQNYARAGGISHSISFPSLKDKKYQEGEEMIDFGSFQNASELQQRIEEMALFDPGSVYNLARYAFRSWDVDHPEVYAYTARYRCPKIKEFAKDLDHPDDALASMQGKGKLGMESIFGSPDRIALPDEVLIFKKGDHRDRALALYALFISLRPEDPEPIVVFTPDQSFLVHDKGVLPLEIPSRTSHPILLAFNSSGHARNLNQEISVF